LIKAKVAAAISGSQPTQAQLDAPTAPLPEAPASITLKATLHGHEVMVTLRGVDFFSVKAQVE
jgi:cytoskeletal protein RodZ